eukprot:scaffold284679_cov33-Prasinocladus_malaysianus.AAC.1
MIILLVRGNLHNWGYDLSTPLQSKNSVNEIADACLDDTNSRSNCSIKSSRARKKADQSRILKGHSDSLQKSHGEN